MDIHVHVLAHHSWSVVIVDSQRCATVRERKGKEEHLYSAFIQRLVSKRSDMDHTVLPANYTMSAFPSASLEAVHPSLVARLAVCPQHCKVTLC